MNNTEMQNLTQNAIKAVVNKNWKEAIDINNQILETVPDDIPSLNRLGIAYSMSGNQTKSTKAFEKVLKISPTNSIAKNNLNRLKNNKTDGLANPYINNVSFIEEPGKSKVVALTSQAEPKIFSILNIGEPVVITPCKHKIKVTSANDQFIGYLPDIISHRLLQLIKGGYKYKTLMKSVNPKSPQVFIQETHSAKKFKGLPSFPLEDGEMLPNLSAGESSEIPPLEIFDPAIGLEE